MAISPMMQNYLDTKEKYPDSILFYRLGDFYEMFFDDAEQVSRELGLTLTGRDCGLEKRAPMCGVPHHAAAAYIKRLVDKGFRVAICEQVGTPNKGKLPMQREVIKVVTAGTVSEDAYLQEGQNNFVASVYRDPKSKVGSVSWCDITTGQFFTCEVKGELNSWTDILHMISAKEVLVNEGFMELKNAEFEKTLQISDLANLSASYDYAFSTHTAAAAILRYFKIITVEIFDFKMNSPIVNSAGALLEYLMITQKQQLANIRRIQVVRSGEFMVLDKIARENLELVHQYREPSAKYGSLLWVLDNTCTPMGARLLTSIINQPLQDKDRINHRLNAVTELADDTVTQRELTAILSKISDISRLAGKVASSVIMPREVLSLSRSLKTLGELKRRMGTFTSGLLHSTCEQFTLLPSVVKLIESAIADLPSANITEGGFIKDGYNEKLDEYRSAGTMGRQWIAKLEAKERLECKIKQLKIGYNRVAGYYFEIPKQFSNDVPYRFSRRATTATAERYITEELKELEEKILGAEERAVNLEIKLFTEIRDTLREHIDVIIKNSDAVAVVDVICSLASAAVANKWVRPKLNEQGIIDLKAARHPVIEKVLGESRFIANDCRLDPAASAMIITGPNMAGKSTFMRTVALNVLLAHIGSYVAASSANIALVDRIFTRIGASDSMLTGQSTFMIEMAECSNILHNATNKSLVLLDEVGRGTGTNDGLALASAIVSYIIDRIGANTMFATHFHELIALANENSKIKNYKALTTQEGGDIVFLHKIEPGIEESSFGIDVAKMAGIPKEVLDNARRIYNTDRIIKTASNTGKKDVNSAYKNLQPKVTKEENQIISRLQEIDVNRLTPMEALVILGEISKDLRD